jgi:hypothetical protein
MSYSSRLRDLIIVARRAIAMQRLRDKIGKHVPAATDTHAIQVLLGTVFSTRSVQRGYKKDNWDNRVSSVWESVGKPGSWKGAAVQRGPERVKLKNIHC